jgi:TP901-1 family phage major tail protein
MAITGPVNGTLISIYKDVSGTLTKIANATSHSIDISKDMIDVTNKDSAGAKEPNNDKATFTGTLQGTGALTIGTVTP